MKIMKVRQQDGTIVSIPLGVGSTLEPKVSEIEAYLGCYTDEDIIGLSADFENNTFVRLAGAKGLEAGDDFNRFPVYRDRVRCNVADDGTINSYYGDGTYTNDGSNGQVMVYQPKFYYKVAPVKLEPQEDGIGYHIRKANYYISSTPKPGFKLHPAFYDKNGNPVDYILYGAYEDNVDGGERDLAFSIAGIDIYPCGAIGPQAELYAQRRGENWHIEDIQALSANQFLMMIEYGTPNVCSILGEGLGSMAGATTGLTSSLGNTSGSASGAISYRGIENPWGNIGKHFLGFHLEPIESKRHVYKPFVLSNNRYYDNLGDTFCQFTVGIDVISYIPAEQSASGYASAFGYGTEEYDWLLLPSEVAGEGSDIDANSQYPIGGLIQFHPNSQMTGVYGEVSNLFDFTHAFEYGGAGCRLVYLPSNEA